MRIAVSGTHGSGKTTLVEDFLAAHPDYVHEPEPYEWLAEVYGEPLSKTAEASDFRRQLEVSVERLRGYDRSACVIAERSPADFLAYILALGESPWFTARTSGRTRAARQVDSPVMPALVREGPYRFVEARDAYFGT